MRNDAPAALILLAVIALSGCTKHPKPPADLASEQKPPSNSIFLRLS